MSSPSANGDASHRSNCSEMENNGQSVILKNVGVNSGGAKGDGVRSHWRLGRHSRAARAAGGAIRKQASRQACLSGSLGRKRQPGNRAQACDPICISVYQRNLIRSCPLPHPAGQPSVAPSRTCPDARLWFNPNRSVFGSARLSTLVSASQALDPSSSFVVKKI